MIGRGLVVKAASTAAMTASVGVAVVALGFAIYYGLAIVLIPAAAAALTALIFAIAAGVCALVLKGKAAPDQAEEDEPEGLTDRAIQLFRTRPILGTVAGLAAGWIFLRNPALATMVAAAFTEKSRGTRRPRR
ncbi:hypothetical protein [Brevundimonas sp.]|uniref:hypothetical protein n=1 Tax=Brevundimonas sp. TaxID=1871086 RepID=UPI0025F4FA0B|nr:hypothetical protein [Brevundimonas sp.]